MTRNEQIYRDKKNMTIPQLCGKYGLSRRAIIYICDQERNREIIREIKKEVRIYRAKYFNAVMSNLAHRNSAAPPED